MTTATGEKIFDRVVPEQPAKNETPEKVVGRQRRIDVMETMQEEVFADAKNFIGRGLVETVQEFAKRFEVKCAAIEARVQRIIDNRVEGAVKDFEGLPEMEKEFFLRKAMEVDFLANPKQTEGEKGAK